jgi:hypothetical protein
MVTQQGTDRSGPAFQWQERHNAELILQQKWRGSIRNANKNNYNGRKNVGRRKRSVSYLRMWSRSGATLMTQDR